MIINAEIQIDNDSIVKLKFDTLEFNLTIFPLKFIVETKKEIISTLKVKCKLGLIVVL